ncbi:MAG: AraC family transcriptional regulator [Ramlibacter sp.]|nr:AraC family transcriptional regulator [Ramlibacter sp.]
MLVTRPPCPALQPFVKTLWAADPQPGQPTRAGAREHVLPTGDMHIAFRLCGPPLKVFEHADDRTGRSFGHAVVGGARSAHYARDTSAPGRSAGAQLRAGAAWALLGAPACALAGMHTPLELLWGAAAGHALEQLDAAGGAWQRLQMLERLLLARLRAAHGLHPAVAHGLQRLVAGASVRDAVAQSGASHRHFIALFREHTGLAPKTYSRLLRFQGALRRLAAEPGLGCAELAADMGYSDQAHFQRDFRDFAGLTPQDWKRAAPRHTHHVPVR